jgi:anaerobic magnesium-protoporphyrin IX monomethyl ester cyclase
MADIVLIYPFFKPRKDVSAFRFPPLGIGYIAAYLSRSGADVEFIDCTFQTQDDVVKQVKDSNPRVIGIQCLLSIEHNALKLAELLKKRCNLLVAGGPSPTVDPVRFLDAFDIVVVGEGEQATLEILQEFGKGESREAIEGIAYKDPNGRIIYTPPRQNLKYLDSLPFPARSLYPNDRYKEHTHGRLGYSITSMITTRGCPFNCDYCSRAVSGSLYRERSKGNVVDEMEEIISYGYDRIWIADDVFTLRKKYVTDICEEILRRKLKFQWECLSRVDTLDFEMASIMKAAGCARVFFGIESGNNNILRKMKKSITVEQSVCAVKSAREAGLNTGGFFILGYPGETDDTILQTLRLSSSLPLSYVSFAFPYPFPGTGLYEKVKDKLLPEYSDYSRNGKPKHKLVFESDFSKHKLSFALFKGKTQFNIRRIFGKKLFPVHKAFEKTTDWIFRLMN